MRTLFPNLRDKMVSTPASLTQVCHLPIPITVPYSACFSSACTATGQRQIIAMNARKAMERDDRMRVDCVRVGLLEVDMMKEKDGCSKTRKIVLLFMRAKSDVSVKSSANPIRGIFLPRFSFILIISRTFHSHCHFSAVCPESPEVTARHVRRQLHTNFRG